MGVHRTSPGGNDGECKDRDCSPKGMDYATIEHLSLEARQKLAQIQSMIDASIERLRDSLKLQNKQGQQEETDGPSDKDLDDMLSNLDIFNQ